MYRSRLAFALAMAALAAILLPSTLPAQITFERTYGGASYDAGFSVQQTVDGGYVIAGLTWSFGAGSYDVYIIKTNANGDTAWTRAYGGINADEGFAVSQTADGGYVIAGLTGSFGAGSDDVYLIKTNAQGDTMWVRAFGGTDFDWGEDVRQTSDGGYIIAGTTVSFSAGRDDVYLIKTDAQGDTLWTRTVGGTYNEHGYSIRQTTDGGYVVAGCTESYGAGIEDVYLIKTDVNGDTLWTRTYGGADVDWAHSVQQTSDGGYVITGTTDSYGAGGPDVYLVKTDSSGDTLWTRTFGGSDDERGNSVQ
jgi:hypothetical protein